MTEEDLIGYLVGALDSDDRVAVEVHLRTHPDAGRRLERMRGLLAPLEADREFTPAPAGLAVRTIARLAAHLVEHEPRTAGASSAVELAAMVQSSLAEPLPECDPLAFPSPARPLSRAPREELETRAVGGRFRPDIFVACGIALVTAGLIFSAVGKVRARNEMLACQNALRVTHTGLSGYADAHNDRYPQIGPDATAESFVSVLASAGQVPANFQVVCPACPAPTLATSTPAVGYTYTLGYRAPGGELVGVRRPSALTDEHDLVPISADYPAASAAPAAGPVCPHTLGMNVLYAGGNVRVTTSPLVGPNHDHIFQNHLGRVGAGTDREDVVLGRPGDRP